MNTYSDLFQPHARSQAEKKPSLLVVVYGNPTHGDDAVDCQITALLRGLELPNVEVSRVEQLTPELSAQLATVDYAVFVHACCLTTDLKIDAIKACGLQSPGSSIPGVNSWPPCSLLALTHSNYGHHPHSWLVKVASRNLVTGHHPSDRMIYHDFEQIEALIQECISGQN